MVGRRRVAGPGLHAEPDVPVPESVADAHAASGRPGIEHVLDRTKRLRRRTLVGLAVIAALSLAVVSAFFGWRYYGAGQRSALNEMRSRVILAAAVFDTYFSGRLAILSAMSGSDALMSGEEDAVRGYIERTQSAGTPPFTAGLGWFDRMGALRVLSEPRRGAFPRKTGLAGYVETVVSTGKPHISRGIVVRGSGQRLIMIGVPTRDGDGRLTGVLAGAMRLTTYRETRRRIVLGYEGLSVIDRSGQQLTTDELERPENRELVSRLRRRGVGIYEDTRGLAGEPGRVVAFATSRVPGWLTVLDRPRSLGFAEARRSLVLGLASTGAATALVLGLIGWAAFHAGRETSRERARVRRWVELTRVLGAASDAAAVARALATSLAEAFPEALAVVAHRPSGEARVSATWAAGARSGLDGARTEDIDRVAEHVYGSEQALSADTADLTNELVELWDGSIRSAYGMSLVSRSGLHVGGLVLAFDQPRRLGESGQAMVTAHCSHAADALARARVQELEHDVAASLQRSLLPAELPAIEGLQIVARYRAGGAGLEVGGDWYDVVRRSDGLVHLSVGDVAGRGIKAAALMGQLRHAGRAYAHEHRSPADLIRGLLRHVPDDGMATLVCVTVDPYTCELAYSTAGHPPSLLGGRSGPVVRLDDAGGPPLGFAGPEDCVESRAALGRGATIVMYTDGLVERRGASIDDGIDMVARRMSENPSLSIAPLADEILRESRAVVAADDDVALLAARLVEVPSRFSVEMAARADALASLRRRLDRWLVLRGVGAEDRQRSLLIVHEACANVAEHAYADRNGLVVVDVLHAADALRIAVRDAGKWRLPAPSEDRGHGIELMRAFSDVFRIEQGDRGTVLTAIRRLGRPEPIGRPEPTA